MTSVVIRSAGNTIFFPPRSLTFSSGHVASFLGSLPAAGRLGKRFFCRKPLSAMICCTTCGSAADDVKVVVGATAAVGCAAQPASARPAIMASATVQPSGLAALEVWAQVVMARESSLVVQSGVSLSNGPWLWNGQLEQMVDDTVAGYAIGPELWLGGIGGATNNSARDQGRGREEYRVVTAGSRLSRQQPSAWYCTGSSTAATSGR